MQQQLQMELSVFHNTKKRNMWVVAECKTLWSSGYIIH